LQLRPCRLHKKTVRGSWVDGAWCVSEDLTSDALVFLPCHWICAMAVRSDEVRAGEGLARLAEVACVLEHGRFSPGLREAIGVMTTGSVQLDLRKSATNSGLSACNRSSRIDVPPIWRCPQPPAQLLTNEPAWGPQCQRPVARPVAETAQRAGGPGQAIESRDPDILTPEKGACRDDLSRSGDDEQSTHVSSADTPRGLCRSGDDEQSTQVDSADTPRGESEEDGWSPKATVLPTSFTLRSAPTSCGGSWKPTLEGSKICP